MWAPGNSLWQVSDFGRIFLHPHALPSVSLPPQLSQRTRAGLSSACDVPEGCWKPKDLLVFSPNAWKFGGLYPEGKSPAFPALLCGQGYWGTGASSGTGVGPGAQRLTVSSV